MCSGNEGDKPTTMLAVPGAPLEIRWCSIPRKTGGDHGPRRSPPRSARQADAKGEWIAKEGRNDRRSFEDPAAVDISISATARALWVSDTLMDGENAVLRPCPNPEARSRPIAKADRQAVFNMIRRSGMAKRALYLNLSCLANSGKGARQRAVLRGFAWAGKEMAQKFEVISQGKPAGPII